MNVLELDTVDSGYGSLNVLRNVSFAVPERSVLALVGPNGAGKTTTMGTIAGVVHQSGGSIRYRGKDVTSRPYYERLKNGIAWVPEGRMIFTDLTVEDNLYVSATAAGKRSDFSEQKARAYELFPVLADRRDLPAGSLSGGQQQMLAIARALVRKPQLVMLDEPSMGLAPSVVIDLASTLRYMLELGLSVLVADQSVSWLEGLPGKVAFIQGGAIKLSGSMDLIRDRELVRRAYLGHIEESQPEV